MHITILALGSRGDVLPCATLGRGLTAAGHRVAFVTTQDFGPVVSEHGLDFYPISGDAQAIVRQAGANMLALMRGFGALARGFAPDIPPGVQDTDLIINQLPLALAGYDIAEKLGVPMIVAAVIPLFPTRAFPLVGLPALRLPGITPALLPGYNRLTYTLAQRLGWLAFRPAVNRWRRQVLGLPPTPLSGYPHQMGTSRFPVLNGFSAHVVPRPPDWGRHVHITGYWFPEEKAWRPPDELRAFLQAGPPPVFFGFGSMPLRDPGRTTGLILEALRRAGQRGVLHSGWGGLAGGELPDYVIKIDYAPYGWLFPRMALVAHHGGSGTTAFGLRAGVPNLVLPLIFDQFFWGKRVAALGVGPQPIPHRRLSVERLAAAIQAGVNDVQMREQAAELGRRIGAENGIGEAIAVVERTAI